MESVIKPGATPSSVSSFSNQTGSDSKYTESSKPNFLHPPTMKVMEQAELETEPSTSNCLIEMKAIHQGAEPAHLGSTKAAVSSTCSRTMTSRNGLEDGKHPLKSSQTSADSERDFHLPNVGHYPPYMPSIDFLHIGAQFAQYFVKDKGHMGIEGGYIHMKYLEELVAEHT